MSQSASMASFSIVSQIHFISSTQHCCCRAVVAIYEAEVFDVGMVTKSVMHVLPKRASALAVDDRNLAVAVLTPRLHKVCDELYRLGWMEFVKIDLAAGDDQLEVGELDGSGHAAIIRDVRSGRQASVNTRMGGCLPGGCHRADDHQHVHGPTHVDEGIATSARAAPRDRNRA